MSILRFSAFKRELYAPDVVGDLDTRRYNHQRGNGFLGLIPEGVVIRGEAAPLTRYVDRRLGVEAAALPPGAPVVVLIHGFLFDPEKRVWPDPPDNDNPHGRVYHFQARHPDEEIREHTTAWPRGLGFQPDDAGATGLAVAFGWYSAPGLAQSLILGGENHYRRAYDYAGQSAWVLVNVLAALADHPALAGRPIDVFCHSLGARVLIRALAMIADTQPVRPEVRPLVGRVGRVVVLGGAEYAVEAQLMMHRLLELAQAPDAPPSLPAFYNVVSRENNVLSVLAQNFGPRTFGNVRVIGRAGLGTAHPGDTWIDLPIDGAELRAWMLARGQDVSGDQPGNVWDHWYYYTYPGNMQFYADVLRNRPAWDIPALRGADIPDGVPG